MTPTDTQLKQALAKMLPEHVAIDNRAGLYWRSSLETISDSELLHLCWLVEKEVPLEKRESYNSWLGMITEQNRMAPRYWTNLNAFWQQRVIALAKVKGVEIV